MVDAQAVAVTESQESSLDGFPPIGSVWEDGCELMMVSEVADALIEIAF